MPRQRSCLPSYAVSKADAALISRIAERAVSLAERHGRRLEFLGVCANLAACHANGCRLDLAALLEADDATFTHDVWGIGRHLDRVTGTLTRFQPRFVAREGAASGKRESYARAPRRAGRVKDTDKRTGVANGALGSEKNGDGATDSVVRVPTKQAGAPTGGSMANSEDKSAA